MTWLYSSLRIGGRYRGNLRDASESSHVGSPAARCHHDDRDAPHGLGPIHSRASFGVASSSQTTSGGGRALAGNLCIALH